MDYSMLNERFPFLTYGKCNDEEIIGIVQNSSKLLITVYEYNKIQDEKKKKLFLKYGEIWWWESNRHIPINLFIGEKFKVFSNTALTVSMKDYQHITGPIICTDTMPIKRAKRKVYQVFRKS